VWIQFCSHWSRNVSRSNTTLHGVRRPLLAGSEAWRNDYEGKASPKLLCQTELNDQCATVKAIYRYGSREY
jgi:hypothetical protein